MYKDYKKIPIENKGFHDINPLDFGSFIVPLDFSQFQCRTAYYMYYIISGSISIKIAGKEVIYNEKNNLCIIPPHTKYEWKCVSNKGASFRWIGFNGALSDSFVALISKNTHYTGNLFLDIADVYRVDAKEEFIAGMMFRLLSELKQYKAVKANNYANSVKHYIRTQFNSTSLNIDSISDALGINRRYMSRIFKESEGITPQEYLIKIRMGHAANLLVLGYSISETARLCGFADQHYFSTAFKNYYGMPPTKFKHNNEA